MLLDNGVDEFTAKELEDLFSDDFQSEPPQTSKQTEPQQQSTTTSQTAGHVEEVDGTKAFAKRLKESTEKVRQEERLAIAKSLGFESFEELQKSRENKLIEDKGLDPTQTSELIDELVKKRLEDDPRLAELEALRKQRVKEFGERELREISELTNGKVTKFSQLSKDVIDLWAKKGSLKKAYLELSGEELINEYKSGQNKSSTAHLASPSGPVGQTTKRLLTATEKKIWRQFNPRMTDEELNKIMVDNK